tara:strand:+ start:1686 stop:1916 length:231 start_codon:yes stop_codon:yes gene_type:complete
MQLTKPPFANWLEDGLCASIEVLGKSKSYSELVSEDGCIMCPNKYPLTFRNVPSYKEYKIAGTCQSCQDKVFGKDV